MKRTLNFRIALASLATWQAMACHAYDGKVFDAVTGAPVENVWVVGHWDGGGGFVISKGGCASGLARTNAKGEFSVVGGDGVFGRLFGQRSRPVLYLYKKGMKERPRDPVKDSDLFYLEKDVGPTLKRLDGLLLILGQTECDNSLSSAKRDVLLKLHRDVHEEAVEIAVSEREKRDQRAILRRLEILDLGYEKGTARADVRSQNDVPLPAREEEQ